MLIACLGVCSGQPQPYAGLGYALLTAYSNATNIFEGAVGARLYQLFSDASFVWLLDAMRGSVLDIAGRTDSRTLILEIFVYLSLLFTLLTIPFIGMLRREFRNTAIAINLDVDPD